MKTEQQQQKNKGGLGTISAAEIFLSGQNWETINSNKPQKNKNKKIVIRNEQKVRKREKKKLVIPT